MFICLIRAMRLSKHSHSNGSFIVESQQVEENRPRHKFIFDTKS